MMVFVDHYDRANPSFAHFRCGIFYGFSGQAGKHICRVTEGQLLGKSRHPVVGYLLLKKPTSHLRLCQIRPYHYLTRSKARSEIQAHLAIFLKYSLKDSHRNSIKQGVFCCKGVEYVWTLPQQCKHAKYVPLITIFHDMGHAIAVFSKVDKALFYDREK